MQGSRNRLTEAFLADLQADWEVNGAALTKALEKHSLISLAARLRGGERETL